MNSIAFPNIFGSAKTNIIENHEAVYSNLRLLLLSTKKELFGDPNFGTNLRRLYFSPNNMILKEIVIDDIYTAILTFMPEVSLKRSDISITQKGNTLSVLIQARNLLDYKTDLYTLDLSSEDLY